MFHQYGYMLHLLFLNDKNYRFFFIFLFERLTNIQRKRQRRNMVFGIYDYRSEACAPTLDLRLHDATWGPLSRFNA